MADALKKARWPAAMTRWAGRIGIALVVLTLGIGVLINHEAGPLLGETAPPESEISEEEALALLEEREAAGLGTTFPTISAGESLSNGFNMPSEIGRAHV